MIKLIEEPVSYDVDSKDIDSTFTWIYKNPTKEEIQENDLYPYDIRILIKDNDYYIASGYYYIHKTMAANLYRYNHIPYKSYDAAFIYKPDHNSIWTGDISSYNNTKPYDILKKFYQIMKSNGLLKSDTVTYDFKSGGTTLEDLFNTIV